MEFNGRVLVCGSRDYGMFINHQGKRTFNWNSLESLTLWNVLEGYRADWREQSLNPFVVIEGRALGADQIAGEWANKQIRNGNRYIQHEMFPADWQNHGKAAGPIRNKKMLEVGKPTLILAFSNNFEASKGTKNMIEQGMKAGVLVVKIEIPPLPKPVESMDNNPLF